MNGTHSIAILKDEIIGASKYGLLRYDRINNTISDFTKVDGLNGVGITEMESSPNGYKALLGYEDGLLELLTEKEIRRIPDIPQSGKYPGKSKIKVCSQYVLVLQDKAPVDTKLVSRTDTAGVGFPRSRGRPHGLAGRWEGPPAV